MSNISGLAVLTLGLGRANLLKENTIQAELPFPKQKPHLNVAPSNHGSLRLSVVGVFHKPLHWRFVPFPHCTGLRGHHALTCASLLSCNKVKKVGWLQVVWNKASSSLYWSPGWRRHGSVCRLEKPQVSPLCTADISSISAGVTSKATGEQVLQPSHRGTNPTAGYKAKEPRN